MYFKVWTCDDFSLVEWTRQSCLFHICDLPVKLQPETLFKNFATITKMISEAGNKWARS